MKVAFTFLIVAVSLGSPAFAQVNGHAGEFPQKPLTTALDGPLKDSLKNPAFVKRYGIVLPAGFDETQKQWVTPEEFNTIPDERKHLFRVKTEGKPKE